MWRKAQSAGTIAAILLALQAWVRKPLGDFHVFFVAAGRALHGGALYRLSDGAYPYKYAPITARLLSLLSLLPEHLAALLWSVGSALALAAAIGLALSLAGARWRFGGLALLLLCFPFAEHLFELGQCDAFLLLLVCWSEAARASRPRLSGAALGLACLFKPPFLVLGALLFWRREGERLTSLAAAVALGLASGVLFRGPAGALGELAAWRHLLAASTPALVCGRQNQSVFALACTLFQAPPPGTTLLLHALAIGFVAVLPLLALFFRAPAEDRAPLGFALCLYLAAFLSPLGWRTNLILLLPALGLLLARASAEGPTRRLARAALAIQAACAILFNYDLLGAPRFFRLLELRGFAWEGLFLALACATAIALGSPAPAISPRSPLPGNQPT